MPSLAPPICPADAASGEIKPTTTETRPTVFAQFLNGQTDALFKFVSSTLRCPDQQRRPRKTFPMRWMEVTLVLGPTRAENAGLTLLPIPIPSKVWKALDADRTKENLPIPGLELAAEFTRPFQSVLHRTSFTNPRLSNDRLLLDAKKGNTFLGIVWGLMRESAFWLPGEQHSQGFLF
jgi:hypothetical protein